MQVRQCIRSINGKCHIAVSQLLLVSWTVQTQRSVEVYLRQNAEPNIANRQKGKSSLAVVVIIIFGIFYDRFLHVYDDECNLINLILL